MTERPPKIGAVLDAAYTCIPGSGIRVQSMVVPGGGARWWCQVVVGSNVSDGSVRRQEKKISGRWAP
jgi:hypothetical protein